VMLKNSVSRFITMNVFGSSQSGDTKNIITNIEQSFKTYTYKFDKIEHLLDQNYKSIHVQKEQVETLQLTSTDIVERMSKIEVSLQNIRENTDGLKKIFPAILNRLNTIETYYKDKP
jgi:hypothetical protein